MKSHVVIFNRAPLSARDGWIHIVPKGELPNTEAKLVQVIDDAALDSILANITKAKNRLGENWPGIYAGREHFIYDETKDSAALGWFKDFEKRGDGLWAKDDGLTPGGADAVKNREYKFTSFVADRSDLKKIAGDRYRVMAIETVGFTNNANAGSVTKQGSALLNPVINRVTASLPPVPEDKCCPDCQCELIGGKSSKLMTCPECHSHFADSSESAANQQRNNQVKNKMKKLNEELGLAAEASEEAQLDAVIKLKNRVTELAPLADENTKLKNRLTEVDSAAVDSLLAQHGVKEPKVLNRLKPIITGLAAADRSAALVDFGFKPGEAGGKPGGTGRVLNRGNGNATQQDAGGTEEADTKAAEQARATKIMNRAKQLMGEVKHLSLATATKMASDEIPA